MILKDESLLTIDPDHKMRSEYITDVLKVMCHIVGASYHKINFKKDGWWYLHEWSKEQEEDFSEWMIKYLYKNKRARHAIGDYPIGNSKKTIKKYVETFIWNYGWKLSSG